MPTYDELMASRPESFNQAAAVLDSTGSTIDDVTVSYGRAWAQGTLTWTGSAKQKATDYVALSCDYARRMAQAALDAGTTLTGLASQLEALTAELRSISGAARTQGFLITEGVVVLGRVHWEEVAAANVASESVLAAYQAEAAAFTSEIFGIVGQATESDLAAARGLAHIALQLGAEVSDLSFAPVGALDPSARALLTAQASAVRDRALQVGLAIRQRKVVGVAQFNIDGQRGSLDSVSGRMAAPYPGTLPEIPPYQRAYNPLVPPDVVRGADAENKIFETLNQRFGSNATGTIHMYSEKEPCPACRQVLAQFVAEHPGIKVFYGWG